MRMWVSFAGGGGRHYSAYPTNRVTFFLLGLWSWRLLKVLQQLLLPSGQRSDSSVWYTKAWLTGPVSSLLIPCVRNTHQHPRFQFPNWEPHFYSFHPSACCCSALCPLLGSVLLILKSDLGCHFLSEGIFALVARATHTYLQYSTFHTVLKLPPLWYPWLACKLLKGKNPILFTLIS